MEELQRICKTLLSNADLVISIDVPNGAIVLNFAPAISLEDIVMRCSKYTRLRVAKTADDDEWFFVGETKLELITSKAELQKLLVEDRWQVNCDTPVEPVFWIRCEGAIMLDIVCGALAWSMGEREFQSVSLPAIAD
ncbi:hypothetical protein H6F67_12570 [Microcoleus sp. FACHB-1515]|uniref:hypothetical protein n=1 Tax=Cyanophyceae TaxID=3028117 RepID=UPI001684157E|nr:hypothetical protein [Microcoleus sp. FACHB-1515]MBD2090688.1 hypothetical protein [Microcoleus sp. FACHB-1515]